MSPVGCAMRNISFETASRGGWTLRGDIRWDGGSARRPVVVVCHGFKGFKNWGFFPWLGERLAAAGFLSVSFNFSGCGVGADLFEFTELDRFAADTITRQIDDLGTVLDGVTSGALGCGVADPRRIAVLGHSRGGGVAVLRAREDRRVGAVVTWAGVAKGLRWPAEERREWRARGFAEFPNARTGQMMRVDVTLLDDLETNAGRFDILRAASESRAPFLIVHGDADLSVPATEASALYGAAPAGRAELLLLPGAGHTFGAEHPWKGPTPALERALEHTIAWLER